MRFVSQAHVAGALIIERSIANKLHLTVCASARDHRLPHIRECITNKTSRFFSMKIANLIKECVVSQLRLCRPRPPPRPHPEVAIFT